jgi:hypothetical protein
MNHHRSSARVGNYSNRRSLLALSALTIVFVTGANVRGIISYYVPDIADGSAGSEVAVVGVVHRVSMHKFVLLLAVSLVVAGCSRSNGLPLAPVRGSVAYRSQVLTRGEVVFTPQSGTPGPPAVGRIQHDGSFVMQTAGVDGAAVGRHKVTVHCRREFTPEEIRQRVLKVPESLIPDKYWKQDKSPLSFDVEAGKTNVYDLKLD